MKTYWDLDETERAQLTTEDVERYIDAELMLKGVLKVKPLVLEPEIVAPVPTASVFTVRIDSYNKLDVAFETVEQARAFLTLKPKHLASEYMTNGSCPYTRVLGDCEISEIRVFTEAEKDAAKAELKRAGAVKAENERRVEESSKAHKLQDEALKGLWDDYYECKARDARLRAVAETYADYQRTAGDDIVAANFLAKVYPLELICEAATRFDRPQMATNIVVAQ